MIGAEQAEKGEEMKTWTECGRIAARGEPSKERFEKKIIKDDAGCWWWTAGKDHKGYGRFGIDGKTQLAHRVSYRLYVGEIPDGLYVCHHCDNPSCVRPDHLFLGTATDNMQDCKSKGRHRYIQPDNSGEKNYHTKLTEEDVRTIRKMRADGARQIDLAKEFGVAPNTISAIVYYRNWAFS